MGYNLGMHVAGLPCVCRSCSATSVQNYEICKRAPFHVCAKLSTRSFVVNVWVSHRLEFSELFNSLVTCVHNRHCS